MATLALVACTQEAVVTTPDHAISFGGAFVENAPNVTKADPSITTKTIDGFNVWAFMDDTDVAILNGDEVVKQGNDWVYSNVQYWVPNHTYYFAAVAPMNSANWEVNTDNADENGVGTLSFTNINGTEDLLYTATSVATPNRAALVAAGMPAVDLTFSHLLSRVKFTFKNGFTSTNYQIEVKNIKMVAPKSGAIDLAVENWWDGNDWVLDLDDEDEIIPVTLEFGNAAKTRTQATSENQRFTIPAPRTQMYAITFDVVLYVSDAEAMTVTKTALLYNTAFEMGKSYNIVATLTPENLGLSPIEFEVEVKDYIEVL